MPIFRYEVVENQSGLVTWSALRARLYLDSGLINHEDLDEFGLYTDEYDRHSQHHIVYAGSDSIEPVGTCRVIDGRTTNLQVANHFEISVASNAFEISGFAVAKEYRKTFITLGFYKIMYAVATDRKYEFAYMEVEFPFLDALREIGLPVEVLSSPRHLYNTENVAVRIRVADVVTSLKSADARRNNLTRFGEFFEEPFQGIVDTADIFSETRVPVAPR
ncbi:GNAT family N-acetyltransferase [Rhodococcus erythropolis]|jgi:N-acyl-L-homoserine lactone synthetase|uniref:N-acyl amino acid synthase FeeM domain-containing protein n=1 Tax=Rhodococcus TaxID=1827 RepID=UPI001BA9022E|nr:MULTISPECIES: GNAT family N-acyltransferase [Rhodococcus]MBS2993024.1 GNAT family N-acetyltransferase [Rhodococcus erythropolis]MDV8128530.1 GNAT family N-acyltransferase [Rhodococcus sp. IEGM 1304]